MRNLNIVAIVGRLGSDPEVKKTKNGKDFVQFNIANNRDYGESERVNWISCTAFGPVAELIAKYLKKGNKALFTGELQESKWEKDGKNYSKLGVLVNTVEFLESSKSSGSSGQTFTPSVEPEYEYEEYEAYDPTDEF